jgi:hypothetical protein
MTAAKNTKGNQTSKKELTATMTMNLLLRGGEHDSKS